MLIMVWLGLGSKQGPAGYAASLFQIHFLTFLLLKRRDEDEGGIIWL